MPGLSTGCGHRLEGDHEGKVLVGGQCWEAGASPSTDFPSFSNWQSLHNLL